MNGWGVWAIIAALVWAAALCISVGASIHSPHYGGHSIAVTMLVTTAVELIITVILVAFSEEGL